MSLVESSDVIYEDKKVHKEAENIYLFIYWFMTGNIIQTHFYTQRPREFTTTCCLLTRPRCVWMLLISGCCGLNCFLLVGVVWINTFKRKKNTCWFFWLIYNWSSVLDSLRVDDDDDDDDAFRRLYFFWPTIQNSNMFSFWSQRKALNHIWEAEICTFWGIFSNIKLMIDSLQI